MMITLGSLIEVMKDKNTNYENKYLLKNTGEFNNCKAKPMVIAITKSTITLIGQKNKKKVK